MSCSQAELSLRYTIRETIVSVVTPPVKLCDANPNRWGIFIEAQTGETVQISLRSQGLVTPGFAHVASSTPLILNWENSRSLATNEFWVNQTTANVNITVIEIIDNGV